jgi:hypothetical protein
MEIFKIRASAISQIMTKSFAQTPKTFCENWLKEQLYCRKKDFSNKYTQKGCIAEDESIDYVAEQLGVGLIFKNETKYENSHIQGTPDVVLKDLIIDVKNSWDNFTFPLFEKQIPNKNYWWQGQGYMDLLGIENYKLIYVLSDTPINLIEREMRSYMYQNGIDEADNDLFEQFEAKMTYKNIPDNLKIKVFEFQKDNDAIKEIYNRVNECREYINKLLINLK